MNYQLKLKDGKTVDLSFSMYFLNRLCKLTDKGISDIFPHILGQVIDVDKGQVIGGLLDDLEIRAAVLAAGMEAHDLSKGRYAPKMVIDGFMIMENIENCLASSIWGDMYAVLCKSVIADSLPKDDAPKKKAAPRRLK